MFTYGQSSTSKYLLSSPKKNASTTVRHKHFNHNLGISGQFLLSRISVYIANNMRFCLIK